MRRLAQEHVGVARSYGWVGPPYDMWVLAELLDIRVEFAEPEEIKDALLLPNPRTGTFVIKVSRGLPLGRRRFNVAHEIAHTFFPDCAERVQLRGGVSKKDVGLERLCDAGASEMLLPHPGFAEDVERCGGLGVRALTVLKELYQASWEATANRMVSTAPTSAAMLVLSHRLKPLELRQPFFPGMEPLPKLRVDYAVCSESLADVFVPPHKSVPPESALNQLPGLDSGATTADTEHSDWSQLGLGAARAEGILLRGAQDEQLVIALLTVAK